MDRLTAQTRAVSVPGNREYNNGWHTALDLANLLAVSEAVTRAALERQESRGAHFREDFPSKSAEFGKINIVIRKRENGQMQIARQPLAAMPPEFQQVNEEMK